MDKPKTPCPTCGCRMYQESGPCASKELLEALRRCAVKLRTTGREFESPRFTDRYGDGPLMLALADQAEAIIAKATGR